jgi:hypothetical protein
MIGMTLSMPRAIMNSTRATGTDASKDCVERDDTLHTIENQKQRKLRETQKQQHNEQRQDERHEQRQA